MNLEDLKSEIKNEVGVLLYFWGDNCNVCQSLRPKIKEMFDDEFGQIKQIYINAKENIEISSHYQVFSIPTMIIFLDNKEFIRETRSVSLHQLSTKLNRPYSMMID